MTQRGSFFVDEHTVETNFASAFGQLQAGHISAKGMYVQYQIPQARTSHAYPVIMVQGAAHTGKTYEQTPDGRMGWGECFVRRGVPAESYRRSLPKLWLREKEWVSPYQIG